ncbi:MAG: MmcQ/YjbR family DNA-binding protein [Phycisphaeraceae bacterium]|nr:MmcQ/YjbR family DNA-binding protein [Phycisphaeraceae bacterium]
MGHTDFRVKGKIFATLPFEGDEDAKGNVPGGVAVLKLTLDQQDEFIQAWPKCFEPVPGGWGERGYTRALLRAVPAKVLRSVVNAAWANTAPKRLITDLRSGTRSNQR